MTARQHLGGVADRTRYDVDQRILLTPGTHVGYRFEADGSAWDSRSLRLRQEVTTLTATPKLLPEPCGLLSLDG